MGVNDRRRSANGIDNFYFRSGVGVKSNVKTAETQGRLDLKCCNMYDMIQPVIDQINKDISARLQEFPKIRTKLWKEYIEKQGEKL